MTVSLHYSVSKAVVTGSAQGIGAAIALSLADEGLAVSLLDLNEIGAKETAARIADATGADVFGFGCDVTDRAQVHEVIADTAAAMAGLDTYIGNAGITRDGMLHKLSDDDWDQVISVNLTGVFAGLQACAPWLRTPGPGRVVLVSSVVLTRLDPKANFFLRTAGVPRL